MADLPDGTMQPDLPPCTHVDIDYFGPLLVKQGRSQIKCYGYLFTCLTMRAVQISLDTDSF